MAAKKSGAIAIERVRAFWAERQGLAGALKKVSAGDVLRRTGWARSVGGCNPYLVLRDRAGIGRAAVDAAALELAIHELPSARGCTYVVPREDFAIALRASQGHGDDAEIATAKKYLGVTDKELDRLSQRVLDAVAKPLDPAAIKEAVGDAVRSLGAEGKKRGVSTTLPLVLGALQTRGLVRRIPIDGRLDQQRYRYVAWEGGGPLPKARLGDDEIAIELARRFFTWTGPATIAQLAWWSGLGVRAARAAAAEIGVVPLEEGDERVMLKGDRAELVGMEIPREPRVAFVSSLDNVLHMRREVRVHLDDADALRDMPGAKDRVGALVDLPYHPIIDRGRVIGLWDWDGVKGELVWKTFGKAAAARDAAEALAAYVAKDLGDVRSFSLDSPESRTERIEALRKAKW